MVGQNSFPAAGAGGTGLNVAWIRDPGGVILEVMHGGWDGRLKAFASVRNAYRAHFGVTLENYQQALAFYRDLLGFDLSLPVGGAAIGEYRLAGGMSRMLGVPAEANWTGVGGHCANARCEMFEFKDAPRTPFHPRVQDPGATYLSVWVSDLDALLAKMRAANITIATPGGAPVIVNHGSRFDIVMGGGATAGPERVHVSRQVLVHDPGGFPVLLMQRVQ
jgi:catechol 2,3-dioxygenase-like lactoylglutathione lyase family enzyme